MVDINKYILFFDKLRSDVDALVQQYYIIIMNFTSEEPSKTGVRKSHSHNLTVIRSGNAPVTRDPHRGVFFSKLYCPRDQGL